MPLDPQAAVILEAMETGGAGISPDTSPQELRDQMNQTASLMEPPEVADVKDMTIPGPAGDIAIRVYKPVESDEPLPGVVFFHGGGWVIGSLDSHDGQVRNLALKSGAMFVAVDYRLAPESPYPAAVEDCYAATLWVGENGEELGIDTNRLAVAGDSAGGNLAAVVSQMVRDKGGPKLSFQLLVYPCCDMDADAYESMKENADGPFLKADMMEYFYRHYMGDTEVIDAYAAPIRADDLSGLPPALVITAELDPLRDEGEAYAKKMAAAGVDSQYIRCDGMFHGFFAFDAFIDKAREAQGEAAEALKKALA